MDYDVLLPYQKRWIEDSAVVKVWEKSRRIGASYVEALASVLEAAKSKEAGGQSSYYLSYSKEMTQQFARDCAFWAKHINAAAGEVEEVALKDEDKDITVYRVRFASGYEIWCLPSVARSLRSKQGRVIIDEAAFVEDLGELIKAAMALLMWGGAVRILSTHNGDDNPFNELISEIHEGKQTYSLHRTTFDEALEQGLYRRICLVQRQEWTPEVEAAWRADIVAHYGDGADEELFCIPSNSGERYFSSALVSGAAEKDVPVFRFGESDAFTFEKEAKREAACVKWFKEVKPTLQSTDNAVVLGEDFARSGDLTVLWFDELLSDETSRTLCVIELRNIPFAQQWQMVRLCCDCLTDFLGGAFDGRGNGQMIAELAAQEYPAAVLPVMITRKWYAEAMPRVKTALEDKTTTVPDDIFIKEDFRPVTLHQGIPLIAERTKQGTNKRHGDGAVAKAMAMFAGAELSETAYQPMTYESVETQNRFRHKGDGDLWD
jgi:phage FluMu gp28-like protein